MSQAPNTLHYPAGSAADGAWSLSLTPERAGWTWTGLRVANLAPGESVVFETGSDEVLVLPLTGACVVECGAETLELAGRDSVFSGPTDFVYAPRDSVVSVAGSGGSGCRFAVPAARARSSYPVRHVPARCASVEARGAGNCSRLVIGYCMPDTLDADRLMVCEVFTPGGNWSSFPPHKHERENLPVENDLEEVYAYRFEAPEAFGVQRLYSRSGDLDETWTVRDLDVLLVPRGYHPFCAAHGYHGYYLNALAAEQRSMAAEDDPDLAWTRDAWPGMSRDPRVPITGRETA